MAQVRVLAGLAPDYFNSDGVQARVAVDMLGVRNDIQLFYGEDAASVLDQLADSGVLTRQQAGAMLARLRDEAEIAAARGVRD